jgi:alpha-beta hydrolase superfamily lysophospholipase
MQRGSSRLAIRIDLPSSAAAATFSAPDLGAIDIPLSRLRLGRAMHWELVGDTTTTTFDGTQHGDTMTGAFREPAGPGTFVLHRLSVSTEAPYAKREVKFVDHGVHLSGTVFAPRDRGRHPAMIFVHGSGPEGRWASAYLADYVARHGIVALIYDKRGVGKSGGDWRTATMSDLVLDARAGINLLARRHDVDPRRIGVWGHSQGGELAPAIAARNPAVAWIIAADGPVGPQFHQDLFRVDTALAKRYSGTQLRDAEALYAEFVDVARTGAPHDQLRRDIARAENAVWLADLAIPDDDSWIWTWYRTAGNYDDTPFWATVSVPVLLIFGGDDQLVPVEPSVDGTRAILAAHGNTKVATRVFAGADHTLHVPPSSPHGWPREPAGFPQVVVSFARGELRP